MVADHNHDPGQGWHVRYVMQRTVPPLDGWVDVETWNADDRAYREAITEAAAMRRRDEMAEHHPDNEWRVVRRWRHQADGEEVID